MTSLVLRPSVRRSSGLASLLAVLAIVACGDDAATTGSSTTDDPTSSTTTGGSATTEGSTTTGSTESGSTSAATDDTTASGVDTGSSTSDGTSSDTGTETTAGPEQSCSAVDILFVIDNSFSMGEYQAQLASAWPDFVDGLWAALPAGTDVHVGVTTTSFFDGPCSELVMECMSTATEQEILEHYITPDAGSTGVNGEQGRLFEWDGRRYFEATVGRDSTELEAWFSQAAVAVAESGCSFEMMSAAAGYAFHPANAAANDGFLRDEGAVLAIVVLTDEPDKSPEGAATYHQMVVDAKAGCGGADCVVVSGIHDQCIEGANDALWQFFGLFPGFVPGGDIEAPEDYAAVMDALVQSIGQTCDQLPPAR